MEVGTILAKKVPIRFLNIQVEQAGSVYGNVLVIFSS